MRQAQRDSFGGDGYGCGEASPQDEDDGDGCGNGEDGMESDGFGGGEHSDIAGNGWCNTDGGASYIALMHREQE